MFEGVGGMVRAMYGFEIPTTFGQLIIYVGVQVVPGNLPYCMALQVLQWYGSVLHVAVVGSMLQLASFGGQHHCSRLWCDVGILYLGGAVWG